ncbi:MAG: hypothetical protein KGL39_39795 [Patescibacteria group bacterium]|nr:hypothetical protein [Patescibacteria group bacterium]
MTEWEISKLRVIGYNEGMGFLEALPEKFPERLCAWCERSYRPRLVHQRFCSKKCKNDLNAYESRVARRVWWQFRDQAKRGNGELKELGLKVGESSRNFPAPDSAEPNPNALQASTDLAHTFVAQTTKPELEPAKPLSESILAADTFHESDLHGNVVHVHARVGGRASKVDVPKVLSGFQRQRATQNRFQVPDSRPDLRALRIADKGPVLRESRKK